MGSTETLSHEYLLFCKQKIRFVADLLL